MFNVMAFQAAQRARADDDPMGLGRAYVAIFDAVTTIRNLLALHPALRGDQTVTVRLRALCRGDRA